MDLVLPVLATLALWWFSTGLIMVLAERSRGLRLVAMAGASVLAAIAVATLWMTRELATPAGAYVASLSALAIWAWHEMSFLFGYLTGPNRGTCPVELVGWPRFRNATATLIHHEAALAATVVGLGFISLTAANPAGFLVFALLFALRLSSKFNLFLGAPHFSDQLLPSRLAHLRSYFRVAPVGPFFVITTSMIALLAASLLWGAAGASSPFDAALLALLGALAALGAVEHLFLALPLQDSVLWRWLLPARDPRRTPDL